MSRPRQVLPGRIYLLTRRCTERRFLLRPGDRTNQAFWYCLAEAAALYDIDVCCAMACANHWHGIIRDRHGRYPEFIERFHKLLAKVQNVHWGRWEAVWTSTEQTSVVHLVEPTDAFDKMIYALTNPVKDHLCEHATDWPGATSIFAQLHDRPIRTRRPHWFFDKQGKMPLEPLLHFTRLPGFEHLSKQEWADKITAAVVAVEHEARAERRELGRGILGRKKILAQSAFDRPQSHEPRRELSPRVAAKNKWRRVETLKRNKLFLEHYRAAFVARRAGDHRVVFPHGAYKLVHHGLVCCAAAPAAKA